MPINTGSSLGDLAARLLQMQQPQNTNQPSLTAIPQLSQSDPFGGGSQPDTTQQILAARFQPQSQVQSPVQQFAQQPMQSPNTQSQPALSIQDLMNNITQLSQPNLNDVSRSIGASIAAKDPSIGPDTIVQKRLAGLKEAAGLQEALAKSQLYSQGGGTGGGGSTIKAAQMLMASNPDLSFADAYSFAKSGLGQGVTYNNGQVTALAGAPQAVGDMAYGKKFGSQQAEINTAADLERQKIIGKGEITPQQNLTKGKAQVSKMVSDLGAVYDSLDAVGGAVNTDNSAAANFGAFIGNTAGGQLMGKMAGTQTQSQRNKIAQARPLLINAIRQSTGMSAKAMDSNAELQFYLKAATDPTLDKQANMEALRKLDELYGLSSGNASPDNNNSQPASPQIHEGWPEPSQYSGKTITDADTGAKYISNGSQWLPARMQ